MRYLYSIYLLLKLQRMRRMRVLCAGLLLSSSLQDSNSAPHPPPTPTTPPACHAVEEVDTVLRKWESSLRAIFGAYAAGDGRLSSLSSSRLLDYSEWMRFIKDLQLLDAAFTQKHATLVFLWSRMSVVDESGVWSPSRRECHNQPSCVHKLSRSKLCTSCPAPSSYRSPHTTRVTSSRPAPPQTPRAA